jgi:hypothetical protein
MLIKSELNPNSFPQFLILFLKSVPLGSILIAAAVALVDHDNADTRVE